MFEKPLDPESVSSFYPTYNYPIFDTSVKSRYRLLMEQRPRPDSHPFNFEGILCKCVFKEGPGDKDNLSNHHLSQIPSKLSHDISCCLSSQCVKKSQASFLLYQSLVIS